MSTKQTVTVFCHQRHGLQLRLHDNHPSSEITTKVPSGMLSLHYGANPNIDADFMAKWQEQNAGDKDMLKLVTVAEQAPAIEGGKPGEDHVTERPDKEASVTDPAPKAEEKPADA